MPISTSVDLGDFRRWLERNRIDIVLFNEQRWWQPVLLCNRLGITTGAYVDYYTEKSIPLFACYDFVLCHARQHLAAMGWHPQVLSIPWGTDVGLFRPQTYEAADGAQVTFFHSCGYSPDRKNTDAVVRAFRGIKGRAQLAIHTQVPLPSTLLTAIRGDAVRSSITVTEETVGPPGLYSMGDVYVYPSKLDGIGLTMAEALACGLPVIASDNPPMNEFVTPDVGQLARIERLYARSDGYYWPACTVDTAHLTSCMQHYVDNFAHLPEYKRAARCHAERHLDWAANAAGLADLFCQVERLSGSQKQDAEQLATKYDQTALACGGELPSSYLVRVVMRRVWARLWRGSSALGR